MLKLFSRHFASKCPYQVLGLTKNSTKAEVKEKYYELAKKYHPDLQNGNSFRFQEIKEAYQKIMSDEVKVQKSPEEKRARTEDFNRKMQSKKPKKSNKYNPEESSHYYYLSLLLVFVIMYPFVYFNTPNSMYQRPIPVTEEEFQRIMQEEDEMD